MITVLACGQGSLACSNLLVTLLSVSSASSVLLVGCTSYRSPFFAPTSPENELRELQRPVPFGGERMHRACLGLGLERIVDTSTVPRYAS